MITVKEITKLCSTTQLRLVAGSDGLRNIVKNVGIHDYEDEREIEKCFFPGDFVLSSLAACKGNKKLADKYLESMINRKVSAIAIKEIFFNEISSHITKLANSKNVVIFFYPQNVYMEDIIVEVSETLKEKEKGIEFEQSINMLLDNELPESKFKALKFEVNPLQYSKIAIMNITSKVKRKESKINKVGDLELAHKYLVSKNLLMIFKYKNGYLGFYSYDTVSKSDRMKLTEIIKDLGVKISDYYVGIDVSENMDALADTIVNSISACHVARLWEKDALEHKDIGVYKYLLPIKKTSSAYIAYEKTLNTLKKSDEENHTHFLETIKCYVENHGEIGRTALTLKQHPNTIRYRLKKASLELNLGDNLKDGGYEELYLLISMYNILELSDK